MKFEYNLNAKLPEAKDYLTIDGQIPSQSSLKVPQTANDPIGLYDCNNSYEFVCPDGSIINLATKEIISDISLNDEIRYISY